MPNPTDDSYHAAREAEYEAALTKWKETKSEADKAVLDVLAEELRASRKALREEGERDGTRQFISIQERV